MVWYCIGVSGYGPLCDLIDGKCGEIHSSEEESTSQMMLADHEELVYNMRTAAMILSGVWIRVCEVGSDIMECLEFGNGLNCI